MKIGIVTTYDEINFGAYLQAYSLMKFIQSLGYDVELINYKSWQYKRNEFIATYYTKNPICLYGKIKKGLKFRKAHKKLSLSRKYSTIQEINNAEYGCIIYGSDEIWNVKNCIGVTDPYYFGSGTRTKKISYAASFGSTSSITDIPELVKQSLSEFECISVRDQNSHNLVKEIGFNNSSVVLDPTFLIDQEVKEIKMKHPYIFYYVVGENKYLDDEVQNLSNKLNIEVISFGYRHKKFKSIIDIDPFEWLGYLKQSEFVVTNMFHGTIFSIKHNKKFITEITPYRENKIGYLLDLFNLRNRTYKQGKLEAILNCQNDFRIINQKLHSLITTSKDFLDSNLKDLN